MIAGILHCRSPTAFFCVLFSVQGGTAGYKPQQTVQPTDRQPQRKQFN